MEMTTLRMITSTQMLHTMRANVDEEKDNIDIHERGKFKIHYSK